VARGISRYRAHGDLLWTAELCVQRAGQEKWTTGPVRARTLVPRPRSKDVHGGRAASPGSPRRRRKSPPYRRIKVSRYVTLRPVLVFRNCHPWVTTARTRGWNCVAPGGGGNFSQAAVNVHHLELFYTVAKSGGISAAVRQDPYGIQQPRSRADAKLEEDVGAKLFERQSIRLTKAGEKLFAHVEPFFSQLPQPRRSAAPGRPRKSASARPTSPCATISPR